MANKPVTTDVTAGSQYGASTLNSNFATLETAVQGCLGRGGTSESPNSMSGDLDMDTNDILNAGTITADEITVGGSSVAASVTASAASAAAASVSAGNAAASEAAVVAIEANLPEWEGSWVTSTVYDTGSLVSEAGNSYICIVAHTAGTFSTDVSSGYWELFAAKGAAGDGTGDMLAANNLSDVANPATSLNNLSGVSTSRTVTAGTGLTGGGALSSNITINAVEASTTVKGIVERSTSPENIAGTSDVVYPTVAGAKEMIDTHSAITKSYASTGQTITSGGLLTLAHGFAEEPKIVTLKLQCTTIDAEYSVGDRIIVYINNSHGSTGSSAKDSGIRLDSTNIYIRFTNNSSVFTITSKSGGIQTNIDNTKWTIYVEALA